MRKLTEEQLIEVFRMTDEEGRSSRYIAKLFGVSKSTIGNILRERDNDKPIVAGSVHAPDASRRKLNGKRFVFTSAQNNTYVHSAFLNSLEVYCEHNEAELIVGTFHYNKNAYQKTDAQDNECWFDPKIRKYILDEEVEVANGLVWCGDLDITPTAVNPMSGFQSYTGSASAIFPHAKLQLEPVPVPKFSEPKSMYTTGTVTLRNYIKRKAGQKAEFHHTFSAVVVDVDDDGVWYAYHVNAESETGEFYHLDKKYTPSGVIEDVAIEAINWGDVHSANLDKLVAAVSWEAEDSMLDLLKPKYQFVHDVFDMNYRNHHNIKNAYFRFKQHVEGKESVSDEILLTTRVIESMRRDYSEVVVVQSNHDLALKRWLTEQDYRSDPVNAEIFLELQLASYRAIRNGEKFDVFEYACKLLNENMSDVRFLTTDESFRIAGNIECGQHFHNGANGGRASISSLCKQGIKYNGGHFHSANAKDGVFSAGLSGKMDMSYNSGQSSWSQSHILTYANGKRTNIFIKNGRFML